jgi:hypothetical protein
VKFSLPQYPLFFGRPDNATLTALGIPTSPIVPTASNAAFAGNVNGNTSKVGSDGTFGFTGSAGIYQIVISRDGINFDPTSTQNRVLRGVSTDGANSVSWDGKDNSGVNFPVGSGYAFRLEVHGGEYHFPCSTPKTTPWAGRPSRCSTRREEPALLQGHALHQRFL